MNHIQRLSIALVDDETAQEPVRRAEPAERDDWLSRVGEIARRGRDATASAEGRRWPAPREDD
jgi:hypothetical protein